MPDRILDRIMRENTDADLLEILAERLTPTDLQSLLLEVYRRRAGRIAPANLLAAYARNRFVRPAASDPQTLLDLDRLAMSIATPLFEPIELAPVCPLGTNSAVAAADQNKAVATIRNTEVVSDSTNVLALECALRRRDHLQSLDQRSQRVRLCASHRLLRAQQFTQAHELAHFRLFGLCTAGRDEGSLRFELESLREHLTFYLRLLAALPDAVYTVGARRVALTDLTQGAYTSSIQTRVFEALAVDFPDVQTGFDPERSSGRNYYASLCFHILVTDHAGREHTLVDGGFTTWTQQLLSNQKERLLISGIGTEHLYGVLRRHA